MGRAQQALPTVMFFDSKICKIELLASLAKNVMNSF